MVVWGGSATLDVENATALAEDGSSQNHGLFNSYGAATLRGGFFTGQGGQYTYGIDNEGSDTTLETENVTALGENGTSYNRGLYNGVGAAATLRGSSFIGREGTSAYGIANYGLDATLEAENVTVLGENGSHNYGLSNSTLGTANVSQSVLEGEYESVSNSGTAQVSNSRLVGGAASGSVTCVLVTRGTTISTDGSFNTCP